MASFFIVATLPAVVTFFFKCWAYIPGVVYSTAPSAIYAVFVATLQSCNCYFLSSGYWAWS